VAHGNSPVTLRVILPFTFTISELIMRFFFLMLQGVLERGLSKLYGLWDELGIDENGKKESMFNFYFTHSKH
jgi:hypothetical protein